MGAGLGRALPPDERRLYARHDGGVRRASSPTPTHQIGRVLDVLRATDQLDDTLVLLISDNGTSAEGGPHRVVQRAPLHPRPRRRRRRHDRPHRRARRPPGLQPLPVGLGVGGQHAAAPVEALHVARRGAHAARSSTGRPASTTPRRSGPRPVLSTPSTCCPRSSTRPASTPRPTIDGVDQQPLDGASLRPTFAADGADAAGRTTQYFEMLGVALDLPRRAGRPPPITSATRSRVERELVPGSHDFDADHWALFHLDEDFAEAHDLAAEHPERVAELEALWWHEAGRNQVLPLDDSLVGRSVAMERHPWPARAPARVPARRRRHRRGLPARHGRRLPPRRRGRGARGRGRGRDLCARRLEQRVGLVPARGPARGGVQPVRGAVPRARPTPR